MAGEICPDCGTKRVGSLRFCRSCRYDFDHGVGRFGRSAEPAIGEDADGDAPEWSVVPSAAPASNWSYEEPQAPEVPQKGRLIKALEWILLLAVLAAAAVAFIVVVNPGLLR